MIAYLVSHYPSISHTFIDREIQGLRAHGIEVKTYSLRSTPEKELLTEADRQAAADTSVILPPPPAELLGAHLGALLRRPGAYLRTLRRATGLGHGGARFALWKLFYFGEAIILWSRLRKAGVRHVHVHFANSASYVADLAATFGERDGLTWSFTMHGPTEFDDVDRYALREKVGSARFVACIGDYCRSQLMKLSPPATWDKLQIVRCGLDPQRFAPVARDGRSGPLEVLCVGRLVPDKGQLVLLDALAALRDDGVAVRTTFVGDGPDRERLERRARELRLDGEVTFTGNVGQDRIRELYGRADVFCLPSFAEGIPVVLMEAMAMGLPVVTSRIMGIPELVRDEDGGLLVEPGRAPALAAALRRLAEDPALRARLGQAGRERVLEEFTTERATEQLLDVLAARGVR